ncbi:DUF5060 domain-containing protein [Portibacter marinus]|uniref:DUF5060 domain-containing protein n=1 Tax=Portibacter marinus TaxID=2898660 RepID=UPI001F1C9964|nr:DUF5060 domain-containing protein [Portibacter marinus]
MKVWVLFILMPLSLWSQQDWQREAVETKGQSFVRNDSAHIAVQNKNDLIGGSEVNAIPVFQKNHKVELDFIGPHMSEMGNQNPFTDVELIVNFIHPEKTYAIRGFFAADGNAAESGADSGNVWSVRFSPDLIGDWTYSAHLDGKPIGAGAFKVVQSDKELPDFRAIGKLKVENGYFKGDRSFWMKMGTNSPENLLAYVDFDNTYRMVAEAREGEAAPPNEVHRYQLHQDDWQEGDPSWRNGKGKALIGGMNYLASRGMNAVYFLTLNINGDGKDVWPYRDPTNFLRFDVSKMAQWEILLDHMEKLGIALHIVLQETENELLLDNGDTGPQRRLYLEELISRFGHHNGIIWNLGEENGDNPWAGKGQNTAQRKEMIRFISENDPYDHPLIIHTLPNEPIRGDVLNELLDEKQLDGISLQVNHRKQAPEVLMEWHDKSKAAGKKWLISMDEIGEWHTGALTDDEDPGHLTLRRYVLWGTLLSGAAGVEWYFGARSSTNDLGTEDWKNRNQLWELSNNARAFFEEHLPYWDMVPDHSSIQLDSAYCLSKPGEIYAVYTPEASNVKIDLSKHLDNFSVGWYDVLKGGSLLQGSKEVIKGGGLIQIGMPPYNSNRDWVILIKRE